MRLRLPPYVTYPLLAGAAYGVLQFIAYRSLYFPMKYPQGWWDAQGAIRAEDIWLETSDHVQLHAWWCRAPDARLATLFLHGNAGNLSHRVAHAREIMAAGSSVLLLDYRGYGRSHGFPTENGLYRDAEAAYHHLAELGYPAKRILVHGESLGTSVAVDLATRFPVGGVILEAPFTSAGDVAQQVLPFLGPLLVRGYRTREKITSIGAPLFIMHGDRDEVIDHGMGRALFEAALEPKSFWAIRGAGHNDIVEAAGAELERKLSDFYRQVEGLSAGAP